MTLAELVKRSSVLAQEKGWDERDIAIPEMIALIHSEASEALEEYRRNAPLSYDGPDGKPEGIAAEFADILIRVGHYSALLGIDLEREVDRKLAYNATRSHRHGGKRI